MSSGRNPKPSAGLLSGVFSFVSRELESFVTTATGGTLDEPESLPIPIIQSRKKERGDYIQKKRVVADDSITPQTYRKRAQHRPERNHAPSDSKRRVRQFTPPQEEYQELSASDDFEEDADGVLKHARKHTEHSTYRGIKRSAIPPRRVSRSDSSDDEPTRTNRRQPDAEKYSDSEHPASSSSPPSPLALKRRQSASMPGSLFPRSPSLVPEDDRHVRFKLKMSSPPSPFSNDDGRAGPSRCQRTTSSVEAAVDHIGDDDADPSVLLPSPTAMKATKLKRRDKGKGRAVDVDAWEANTSGDFRVKGKKRELAAAKADQRKCETRSEEDRLDEDDVEWETGGDKERIRMLEEEIARLKEELSKRPRLHTAANLRPPPTPPPPPPPPPPMIPGSSRIPIAGDPGTLFASARAALKHAPPPIEAPINSQLPTRRKGKPAIGIAPDKMAAFLKEMKTVRLRKVSGNLPPSLNSSFSHQPVASGSTFRDVLRRSTSASNFLHADARVGDKRKRIADDLAEFQDHLRIAVKRRSLASSDSSFASTSSSSQQSHSYPSTSRLNIPSGTWLSASISTSAVDAATPSLCSDNDIDNRDADDDHVPSTPPIPPFRNVFRFRQNGIPVKPDERDARAKGPEIIDVDMLDDRGMIAISQTTDARVGLTLMPPPPPPRPPVSPHVTKLQSAEVFAKRPPTSPMPGHASPVKPRPPGRGRPALSCLPALQREDKRRPGESDEEDDADPLSLSFEDSNPESTFSLRASRKSKVQKQQQQRPSSNNPKPALTKPNNTQKQQHRRQPHQSQDRERVQETSKQPSVASAASARSHNQSTNCASRSGQSLQRKRRPTLDEELRNVGFDYQDDDDELESGVLIGVGTRSKKRGFLAHGGAGGAPVFMGIGYVEGAEEDGEEDENGG
ncbi:hypothetical protein D9615_004205 [Tricholomella constricta]|uniref:Uncharacterized protein n=1 Tax=Tricholomella constricta TaxID=117010 RepID=A0A8H5HEZ6_9AGAR|nr:hypothetical protein D9615_004205 [Tricholomella constricta]